MSAAIFYVISASNRSSLNSYHLYIAEQIANEPLVVFRSLGFRAIAGSRCNTIGDYAINTWQSIEQKSCVTGILRPEAASLFERHISFQELNDSNVNAVLINIRVRPINKEKSGILAAKNEVMCSDIIIE